MKNIVYVLQIIFAVLLIVTILIQSKGSGLGMAFGGGGVVYRTKRGAEKIIFRGTIVLAILFMLASSAHLFV